MAKNVFTTILFLLVGFYPFSLYSQDFTGSPLLASDQALQQKWVDSVYESLSWDERIAQLFMVPAYSNGDRKHLRQVEQLIKTYKIGGLIFMQGGPVRQAQWSNRLQALSDIPLLIGMDLEWGLSMRLDSTLRYPNQLTLGAITNDTLIYEMGLDIGRQMKIMGVHMNFAPVADINSNAENPVIGFRSFGENRDQVSNKAMHYMKGLQAQDVIACIKHFPGHGNTTTDSHKSLPVVNLSRTHLDSVELYPFRNLIDNGAMAIMNAHLSVNAIDNTSSLPSSLSDKIVRDLLKTQMNFKGLVITDALNMKSASEAYTPGKLEVEALKAGNDLLLFSENTPLAIKMIRKAMLKRQLKKDRIAQSVKKILMAKYKVGLADYHPVNTDNLHLKLHPKESEALIKKLYEHSTTIVSNKDDLLPLRLIDTVTFASLSLNDKAPHFHKLLGEYAKFDMFDNLSYKSEALFDRLKAYEVIVIGVFGMNHSPQKDYGLKNKDIDLIKRLSQHTRVIVSVFGNPYSLTSFEQIDHLICAYDNNRYTQSIVPEIIFGAIGSKGLVPVSISSQTHQGSGIITSGKLRLGTAIPEAVKMDSRTLQKIDRIAEEAIQKMATPGCQVLVARKGKIVFHKSYGYHTYDSLNAVNTSTLYDLASITKVAASLQAIIFMEENGLIDLDKKISYYLTDLKGTNKEDMTIRDILSHQSGLWPYLPFWTHTMNRDTYLPQYYSHTPDTDFPYFVSEGLYASKDIRDIVWEWVISSKLRKKKKSEPYSYKYSDMGYYMMHRLAEQILNQPMGDFLSQNLYEPLGLTTLGYNPLDKFPKHRIAPTELDSVFRKSQIWGTVHDQGAALFGGVAGHAGLFANARDLATLIQMHLQGGQYGGHRYFNKATLDKFSDQQYANYNRRGAGWDKPLQGAWYGPTSRYASAHTYGHTGFTGTAVWADPDQDLIMVFLSNRIYPDAGNRKLIQDNIRTRIQDLIYESIWEYNKYH